MIFMSQCAPRPERSVMPRKFLRSLTIALLAFVSVSLAAQPATPGVPPPDAPAGDAAAPSSAAPGEPGVPVSGLPARPMRTNTFRPRPPFAGTNLPAGLTNHTAKPGLSSLGLPAGASTNTAASTTPRVEPPKSALSPVVLPGAKPDLSKAPAGALPAAPGLPTPNPAESTASNTPPEEEDENAANVDLKLPGIPLEQFLDEYTVHSGKTILRAANLPTPVMTLVTTKPLTRKEAIEAMESVLALNGIVMIPIGEKFVKAVIAADAEKTGGEFSKLKGSELPDSEQFVTKIVKLEVAKPTEIAQILTGFTKSAGAVTAIDSNHTLVLRDYASNVKRMMELIKEVDVKAESDFKLEVIPIKYGKVTDIYATMSALIAGGGSGGGGPSALAGAGATGGFNSGANRRNGGSSSRFGSNSRNSGGYGANSAYGNNRSSYGGGYSGISPYQSAPPAATAQNSFQQRLNQIVNKASGTPEENKVLENANIVADERSNKLLIFANKKDLEMITNLVAKVDTLLAQVLIEAIILQVNIGDKLDTGVSIAQNPKNFGGNVTGAGASKSSASFFGSLTNFPGATPDGFSYFGKIGDSFDVAVKAIAEGSTAKVVSRPRIQTSHAIEGTFFIGETRPYVTGFNDYSGYAGSGLSTRSQVTERQIGLDLSVTPFITPEGLVVMEINQNFEQPGRDVIIDGNPVPSVSTRAAAATLTVRDKDVIMLGGYITEEKRKSRSGIPFLKDIPGLGILFGTRSDSTDRTELVILIRATILATPEKAAFVAKEVQDGMAGIRDATKTFDEDNKKRVDKQEKKELKKHRGQD